MPLSAEQKAERRAKAALAEGRTFHPRTATNKLGLEKLEREATEQAERAKKATRKQLRKNRFTAGMRTLYKTRLAYYGGELVMAVEAVGTFEEQVTASKQRLVHGAAQALAAAYALEVGSILEIPGFSGWVYDFYSQVRFAGMDESALAEHARDAGEYAMSEANRLAEERKRARLECWQRQRDWEQMTQLRSQAESYACKRLWQMTGCTKCDSCRAVQQSSCNWHCLNHQAVFEALCTEWLNSAQAVQTTVVECA